MTVLELDEVRKTYPGEPPVESLRGVSLAIEHGDMGGRAKRRAPGQEALDEFWVGTLTPADQFTSGPHT